MLVSVQLSSVLTKGLRGVSIENFIFTLKSCMGVLNTLVITKV